MEVKKMKQIDSKKQWYEINKNFLREFEKTEEFKAFRNQRIRVQMLNRLLEREKRILDKLKSKSNAKKEDFLKNKL